MAKTNDFNSLYKEFVALLGSGNQTNAREFVMTHFSEFPEQVQKGIVLAFFEDGAMKRAAVNRFASDFQKRGLESIKFLERMDQILEEKAKQ